MDPPVYPDAEAGRVPVAAIIRAVAAAAPDAECLIGPGAARSTRAQFADRARRFSWALVSEGLGCFRERDELLPHESGQDHLAILMLNRPEYLEAMVGAFNARVAPFNVNHRYTATELVEVLTDAKATAIVVEHQFLDVLRPALHRLPLLRRVFCVDGQAEGAIDYEAALAAAPEGYPSVEPSADDLYLLYTGGTTGRPKGVMWRNGDAVIECFDAARTAQPLEAFLDVMRPDLRSLTCAPFMHGAGQWTAMRAMLAGGCVVIPEHTDHLDPVDVWHTIERESVTLLGIVGESFARPLLDEFERGGHDASSLNVVLTGGAPLSARTKARLLDALPTVMVVDGFGSSESGGQMSIVSTAGAASSGVFRPRQNRTVVLSADRTSVLSAGSEDVGWLATGGRLPLGYLGDPELTALAYPTIGGVRYAAPGDHARRRADGSIEALGRESVCINTGGEKVYAEEVEDAVLRHRSVLDCIVVGRPSETWGSEVAAVISLAHPAMDAPEPSELAGLMGDLARFKHPKSVIVVDEIRRSPAGKADYAWAREVASQPR
ncbi:MAG: AMP-binding protein [Ilumatobacteraceae bacterium]